MRFPRERLDDQRHKLAHGEQAAALVDHAGSVAIAIEDDSEVGAFGDHGLLAFVRPRVGRRGVDPAEVAQAPRVNLDDLAAEAPQNAGKHARARTVHGIDDDLEWLRKRRALPHRRKETRDIGLHHLDDVDGAPGIIRRRRNELLHLVEEFPVARAAVGSTRHDSAVLAGKLAGGDHHGADRLVIVGAGPGERGRRACGGSQLGVKATCGDSGSVFRRESVLVASFPAVVAEANHIGMLIQRLFTSRGSRWQRRASRSSRPASADSR